MDLELPGKDEGGTEDQETFVVDEVLFVHQHECGGGDQSDCGRTQTRKGGNDIFVVLELGKKIGDDQYQYERRQTYGKCGQTGTEDSHKWRISGIMYGRIADISRTIDPDRTGCHLRDCDNVRELLQRYPFVAVHYISLYQ